MVKPVLGQRGDAQGALALDRAEDPHHARGAHRKAVAWQRLDRPDRDAVLLAHAPFDGWLQADRRSRGDRHRSIVHDAIIGHITWLKCMPTVPRGDVPEMP